MSERQKPRWYQHEGVQKAADLLTGIEYTVAVGLGIIGILLANPALFGGGVASGALAYATKRAWDQYTKK